MVGRAEHVGGDADVDAVVGRYQSAEDQSRTVDLNAGRLEHCVATLSGRDSRSKQSGEGGVVEPHEFPLVWQHQRALSGRSCISQAVFYATSCQFTSGITFSVTFAINTSFSVLAKMNASLGYKRFAVAAEPEAIFKSIIVMNLYKY